jgi:hypothetical protein
MTETTTSLQNYSAPWSSNPDFSKADGVSEEFIMSQPERFEILVLGSGEGANIWLGTWRNPGIVRPSWNAN